MLIYLNYDFMMGVKKMEIPNLYLDNRFQITI